jgi:phenylacetate-coenzyme A ligase PaaK-like adenylate-forming protein
VARRLQQRILEQLRVRLAVSVLDPGTLPRTEMGKAKRVLELIPEGEK